ncbi:cysteine desulfurase family protein [Flammeovirga agarivorans]|uniref:cysteine desulfurase n=1 Tax=Flammeovirga agarivorans TaxID=2726742 RepID=A0A7X8SKJ3_9BACT|nr:cysteine desulfurase family protein [Flammeovirga agarivorans]NLR91911.1 cysteine desulfurase [Flammeovirga agarivorans]
MIYLDNAASTPIKKEVLEVIIDTYEHQIGNASSTHIYGKKLKNALNNSIQKVEALFNARDYKTVFTSGATESINLAIKGIFQSYFEKGNHIITSKTEHKAVLDTCEFLEDIGAEVTYLTPDQNGIIDPKDIETSISDETILVTIMYANNETGVIQPINEISDICKRNDVIFMTDATQAVGKLAIDLNYSNIDLLTFSGHKIHGPQGVGGLLIKEGINLISQIHGGQQQNSLRSGTYNISNIIGLGKACELAFIDLEENIEKLQHFQQYFEKEITKLKSVEVNANKVDRLPNISNINFKGIDSNMLLRKFENEIAFSSGSACTAEIIEPSHVLRAMNFSDDDAFSSLRFSFSILNTIEEIKKATKQISSFILSLKESHQS